MITATDKEEVMKTKMLAQLPTPVRTQAYKGLSRCTTWGTSSASPLPPSGRDRRRGPTQYTPEGCAAVDDSSSKRQRRVMRTRNRRTGIVGAWKRVASRVPTTSTRPSLLNKNEEASQSSRRTLPHEGPHLPVPSCRVAQSVPPWT